MGIVKKIWWWVGNNQSGLFIDYGYQMTVWGQPDLLFQVTYNDIQDPIQYPSSGIDSELVQGVNITTATLQVIVTSDGPVSIDLIITPFTNGIPSEDTVTILSGNAINNSFLFDVLQTGDEYILDISAL